MKQPGIFFFFFMGVFGCQQPAKQTGHFEVSTFHLKPEISDQQFVEVNQRVSDFLNEQPGFLHRGLGKMNDSVWVDVLAWQTKEDFENAFEKSASDRDIIEMSSMIKEGKMNSLSFQPKLLVK